MPNSTTDIYSSLEAFSEYIRTISIDDIEADRKFCDPNLEKEPPPRHDPKSFGPKVGIIPDVWGRKKERSINKWLRNRTSSLDCGKEITNKKGKRHPIHLNTNQQVLNFFEDLRFDRRTWLRKVSDKNFADHRAEIETYYFAGNSKPRDPETLVLIDIDCKEFGTLTGALAFAEFLKERFFPNLYIEVSTHGKGAHGFFVLNKEGYGAEYINDLLLHRLQPWMRQLLKEGDFDVENVEIKGTLPVIEWGDSKHEVLTYKAGTLAKLPRLPDSGSEEALRNTTIVSVDDLQRLPIVKTEATEQRTPNKQPAKLRVVSGSITGKHISEEEIAEIDGHYRMVAETLLDSHAQETSGSTIVTVEDVAIWLMLVKHFTNNMNPDGSLPTNRWREMWRALSQADDISRAYCTQRFSVIRDHLSSLGLLAWEDNTYRLGYIDEYGEYQKGKAAKWKANDQLMAMLELPEVSQTIEGERERTSFRRTILSSFWNSLVQQPKSETIKPVLLLPEPELMPSPDEVTRLIKPFEAFTGLAA